MSRSHHSLAAPLDGRAIFDRASSVAGLTVGWERVRENAGSTSGDGETIDSFAAQSGKIIAALSGALLDGSYRPGPRTAAYRVRRKTSGGKRKLTIPGVHDRVAQ